jgi:hypothetical protein
VDPFDPDQGVCGRMTTGGARKGWTEIATMLDMTRQSARERWREID